MKNKKGVSVVIGYVLLITFGIILSFVVYTYLKTYIPSEIMGCPEGASIFLKDYSCTDNQLNITLKNNGKFNLEGYFIHGTNSSEENLATVNLAKSFSESNFDGMNTSSVVYFHVPVSNSLEPGDDIFHIFDLKNKVYSLEIIPARFQEEGSTEKFVSCGAAKIKEILTCS